MFSHHATRKSGPPGEKHSAPKKSVSEPNPVWQNLALRGFQARLRVSQPQDAAEIEADEVAEQLVARRPAAVAPVNTGHLQRQTKDEEEEEATSILVPPGSEVTEELPAKRRTDGPLEVDTGMAARIERSAGHGAFLQPADRARFEAGLGLDLRDVRIHDDSEAAELTNATDALAFTHGQDIYFSNGSYAPQTESGQRLLAHEITHVAQQAHGASTVQRAPKRKQTGAEISSYSFKIDFPKGTKPGPNDFIVTVFAQAFSVSTEKAKDLLSRHPGRWSNFSITDEESAKGSKEVGIASTIYDSVMAELRPGDPTVDPSEGDTSTSGPGGGTDPKATEKKAAKSKAERAKEFGALPKSEKEKINKEADEEFWKRVNDPDRRKLDPQKHPEDKAQAELWKKIRDELLRIRKMLGDLPPAARDALGDPSQYTPAQYDQLLRIGNTLASLPAEDLLLFRIISASTTTDLDAVEKGLNNFIKFKEKYRQALEAQAAQPPASGQPGGVPGATADKGEVPLEQQLDKAWEDFDKAKFGTMTRAQKESTARDIAMQRSATQLKHMATHPGETAVGMVKGLNPGEVAKGIEKDIKNYKDSESSWGKWAAGTGIGSKVSGWVAGVAAVAWVVMWFIPGVNLVNAMATAMAIAFAAGIAAVVLSGTSAELHIQAAASAKSEGSYEREVNAAADEMTSFAMGVIVLAAAFMLKFLGRVKFVQRNLNIAKFLNDAKVKAWSAVGVDALKAVRQEATAAIQAELAALDAELKPAQAEHLGLRKQIEAMSPQELMKKIAADPEFAKNFGLSPEQAKSFGPAAEGPLGEHGAPKVKAKMLEAMDDAAAQAQARIDKFKADVQKVIDDLNSANDQSSFDAAVERAKTALSPEEQARVSAESGKAYEQRKLKAAADDLEAQMAKAKADAEAAAKAAPPAEEAPADPTKQPAGGSKEKPPAAAAKDPYSTFAEQNGLPETTATELRNAGVDLKRVSALMKGDKYPGKTAEVAAQTAVSEVGLAKRLETAGLAKGKAAQQVARWAGDAGIIERVNKLLDHANAGKYGNPKNLTKMLEWIGKGAKEHIQAIDDALSRLDKGHKVDIEAEADVVDHTEREAIQHKQVKGKAGEALGDNVKSALKQLAGKGAAGEVPPKGYKRVADIRLQENNPNFKSDGATLEKYLKEMKAESDRVGVDRDANPNAKLEGVSSDLEVRVTNANGTFKFTGPDFNLAP